MVDSKKRNKRQQAWMNENKDRINVAFSKGVKDNVAKAAAAVRMSRSQWIELAIREKLARDAAVLEPQADVLDGIEEIPPDEWDLAMMERAERENDGKTISLEELLKEEGLAYADLQD